MTPISSPQLLVSCHTAWPDLPATPEAQELDAWWRAQIDFAAPRIAQLIGEPLDAWETVVTGHRAHRHAWYDQVANTASLDEIAAFFWENRLLPPFSSLVARTFAAQLTESGRRAIQRNLDDEFHPTPHAELLQRLMRALRDRASQTEPGTPYRSLADRTLVFHYGYHRDPWALVGALFATEAMACYRMERLGRGLSRVGLTPHELEFVTLHLTCDEHHAREWHDDVVLPSVQQVPELLPRIAAGVAVCLETSAGYLDDLIHQAHTRRNP
jgi:hypothetical protein